MSAAAARANVTRAELRAQRPARGRARGADEAAQQGVPHLHRHPHARRARVGAARRHPERASAGHDRRGHRLGRRGRASRRRGSKVTEAASVAEAKALVEKGTVKAAVVPGEADSPLAVTIIALDSAPDDVIAA